MKLTRRAVTVAAAAAAILAATAGLAAATAQAPVRGTGTAFPARSSQYTVKAKIPVGLLPNFVAVDSRAHTAYVVNATINNWAAVSVISTVTDRVVNAITVGLYLGAADSGVAVNPRTGRVYVGINDHIDVIGVRADKIIGKINTSPYASNDIAVNPVTNLIYVTDGSGVLVINGWNGHVTATINANAAVYGIAVNTRTDAIYADSGSGQMLVINGRTSQVTATVTVPGYSRMIAVDQRTGTVYSTVHYPAGITVINGSTHQITGTIPIGDWEPDAIAVNQQTGTLYVAAIFGLLVIDPATGQVVTSLSMNSDASAIAYFGSTIYLTELEPPYTRSGLLWVITTPTGQ